MFNNFFTFILCMYVACADHGTSGMSEDSLRSLFSLSVMWIPGIKLVSSDLAGCKCLQPLSPLASPTKIDFKNSGNGRVQVIFATDPRCQVVNFCGCSLYLFLSAEDACYCCDLTDFVLTAACRTCVCCVC